MTNTPDEIKKGLECCIGDDEDVCCYECMYCGEIRCIRKLTDDALALIQQLQAENADQAVRIQQLEKRVIHLEALNQSDLTTITMQERTRARFQERISQLEADNAKKDETIQMLQDGNASLMRMIDEECEKTVTLEAERDAALADFKLYRERNIKGECGVYACDLCKRGGRYEDWDEIKCPTGCSGVSHWEWRGVQKEE